MKLIYFILAIISCADITDTNFRDALSCKNSGRILICNLTNKNSAALVNKAINDCTSNCSLTGFELNIMIPLVGEIKLDQIADNILYLLINNRQNSSISLTSTNNSENLRTLTLFTDNAVTGKYSIDNNSFFSHFPRIEKISISNVIFQSLPSFTHLYSLTYLHINHVYFSNNSNRSIQEEFVGGLYQLKDLQINDSSPPISRISELAFKDLSSLISLNLDNNNIQSISENQFSDSHALNNISLKSNNLTNLYLQTFQQFPQLSSIDVSDNPLNCCSCALQWISVAIQKYDFPFIAPACQYPYNNLTATSPCVYESCPPLSLSLQCMNKSTPLCPSNLSCYNTVNSYQCSACPPGYGQVSDYRCVDLDSCSRIPAPCGDRMCVNTVDSFICLSPSNPCDIRNGGCEQKCEHNGSSHWCTCYPGFELIDTTGECANTVSSFGQEIFYLMLGVILILAIILWIIIAVGFIMLCCYLNRNKFKQYHILKPEREPPRLHPMSYDVIPLLGMDNSVTDPNSNDSLDEYD